MNLNAITTLTAMFGRTPTEEELSKYNTIFDRYNLKLKQLYADYINALYTGVSKDNIVAVKVDYQCFVREINASQEVKQNELLLKIQDAINDALNESSKAYKNYLTKSQLLSGQLTDEVIKEFSSSNIEADPKTLN